MVAKVVTGIAFLRQELAKLFMKRAAKKSGIMTLPFKNKKLQLDIEDRVQEYVLNAQKQGVDLNTMSNQNLKYTVQLNEKPTPLVRFDNDDLRTLSADSPEGRQITEALLGKRKAEVVDMAGKKIKNPQNIMGGQEVETDIVTETITLIKSKKPIEGMKEANSVIGRKGKYKNLTEEQSQKILKDTNDHIFERDIPIDPEDMATGGRAGLYQGGHAEIQPDLSDIGHGSDALMARNTLLTPGSQATTSTGLNYLLGEDNDTTRVPYEHGDMVLPKPKPMDEYMLKQVLSPAGAKTLDTRTRDMFIKMYKKKIREKNKKADGGRTEFKWGGPGGKSPGTNTDGSAVGSGTKDNGGYQNVHQTGAITQTPGRTVTTGGNNTTTVPEKIVKAADTFNTANKAYNIFKGGGLKSLFTSNPWALGAMALGKMNQKKKSLANQINSNKTYSNPFDNPELIYNERTGKFTDASGNIVNSNTLGAKQIGYIPKEFKPSGQYSDSLAKGLYKKAIEEGVGAKEFGSWLKKDGSMLKETHPDYANTLSKQLTLSDNVKALGEDYVRGFDIKGLGDSYDDQRKAVGTLLGDLKTKKEALKGTDKEMYLDSKDEFMKSLGVSEFASDYSKNEDRLNDLGITSLDEYKEFLNKSIGLAEGGPARQKFGLGRRAFLKWMASGAAGIGAAKSGLFSLLKGGGKKQVIKELTSVPINNIDGMPVWFKPLVNKVIKEGDDVTKKFADADRQIVHTTKLPNSQTDVIVTQDLSTGNVSVDIGMGKHGFKDGLHGQPVRLEYKAAEDIMRGPDMDDMHKVGVRDPHIKVKRRDEMTFDQKKHPDKAPEEFWVEEAEFTGGHPENVKFEDVSYEKFGQHGSNFDEVEKFATGKVKKTKTTESRVFGKKYLSEGDDMASGGRVPMIFGGSAGVRAMIASIKAGLNKGRTKKIKTLFPNYSVEEKKLLKLGEKFLPRDAATLAAKEVEGKAEGIQILIDRLLHDKKILKKIAENKAMDDPGLNFMMKHLEETMYPPHLKKYKNIDKDILQLETIKKNLTMKDRKLNATGGRVPRSGGGILKILKGFLKKKPKKLETVKGFIEKRNFLKGMIGNSEKNKKARELKMLKDAMDEARRNPGFKFKDIDIDKDIRPIFDQSKDRKLHSTGGIAAMLGE